MLNCAMAIISLFKSRKPRKAAEKPAVVNEEVVAQPSPKASAGKSAGRQVVLTPLVSEKGVDRQVLNQVVFRVTAQSTKGQISQAVQEEYGVRPIKVRTIRMHPKRRTRGRTAGFTTIWKKAYVTVADLKPFNVTL